MEGSGVKTTPNATKVFSSSTDGFRVAIGSNEAESRDEEFKRLNTSDSVHGQPLD